MSNPHSRDGLRFTKSHDFVGFPTAAGAYRAEALTDSGTGEPTKWDVHIGKRKAFLPFIERFDFGSVAQ